MNSRPNPHLETRIARVCEYIEQNLDAKLSLDTLSAVAALSKCHFQRVFSAWTGVSATRFAQLARLRRASFRVAFEDGLRMIDIALEAGFDSPEAFSRAFRNAFGQSPSGFRAAPAWPQWHARFDFKRPSKRETTMNVKIVNFEDTPIALVEHRGDPKRVLETAAKFIAWRKATGRSPVKTSMTFGIPHSDPKTTEPDDFRFDIAGSIEGDVPANDYGVKSGLIPGGRCAVVRHTGSHDRIDESIYPLYRDWLPQSGETLRDFPCFFHYLNLIHEVDECELLTDIYLPVE
ncbi:AraC family transcriptional regulator [Denitromonas iodatirespirans]|uniref:AraC family transcriptional regulator n=1 Tax=Denitromonas iodatirespirans TaxID=2795389 RepID=A0A944HAA8_DENI1|nr:AraC family transcriptional regulator [Denitromonas iodatirespirans]MBT0964104.1 AraC family transcriptional regulator [Denitromonas iodatirespirans]